MGSWAFMTAQVSDTVVFRGKTYSIAGVLGGPLFDPAEFGIEPVMMNTACWRGYVCTYGFTRERLHLVELEIGSRSLFHGAAMTGESELFGVLPEADRGWGAFKYAGLDVAIPFSGGLLLGADFIRSLYVHMGFHPAWKFCSVVEVLLDEGRVTEWHDRSIDVERIRHAIESGESPEPDRRKDMHSWIERTFTLDYGRTFGSS